MLAPPRDLTPDLIAAGHRYLAVLGPAIDDADPGGSVEPRSRLLCAALGLLAEAAHRALGGDENAPAAGHAAAMLSLLTKIDDQVIDAPPFHGGSSPSRAALRARTRAFLAPTLASIRTARPASAEPRCALAAALGASLRALARHPTDLEHLLATIAAGWEIQVDAVAVLTSHPAAVTREEVESVTRAISGAWLLMIAMVGTLPEGASRPFTIREEEAFFAWGAAIQRADALADLGKDLADGHLSSFAGILLWERAGSTYLDAVRRGDVAAVYALVRAHGVDRDSVPDAAAVSALARPLAGLGEVPALLAWIHTYLVGRYEAHPRSRALTTGRLVPAGVVSGAAFVAEASCSAR